VIVVHPSTHPSTHRPHLHASCIHLSLCPFV
jgi:hypothetical protein